MTERITYRDINEGRQARNWHTRFDDPFAQQEMTEQPDTIAENSSLQIDYNNARELDQTRFEDPSRFLDTQIGMLPPEARAEIHATLPNHSFYEGEIIK